MFYLNPLDLANAWWQHLIMLPIAGILGYILSYQKNAGIILALRSQVDRLSADVKSCRRTLPSQMLSWSEAATTDDLKKIAGISPQVEKLLHKSDVYSYSQLSRLTSEELEGILESGGISIQMHKPNSWPKQASLAASGRWQDLKEWQDLLTRKA